MSVDPFTYALNEAQWAKIGIAVRKGLGFDPDPALRERIETLAALHLRSRHLPRLREQRDDCEKRLARIATRRAWLRRTGYAGTAARLDADEAELITQKGALDNLIASLPAPSSSNPTAARELFWEAALSIWRELGGRDSGVDAADFLRTVTRPMPLPRVSMMYLPTRKATVEWLRVRARKSDQR